MEEKNYNIFISWSGTRSKLVALALRDFVGNVRQDAVPWCSEVDIEAGAKSFHEITSQIKNVELGIVCLTKENYLKPWVLFEAGGLANGLGKERMFPLSIDFKEKADVPAPIGNYQLKQLEKEDIWSMMQTINQRIGPRPLENDKLEKAFQLHWPAFEMEYKSIIEKTLENNRPTKRSTDEILEEVLSGIRSLGQSLDTINKRLTNLEVPNDLNFIQSKFYTRLHSNEVHLSHDVTSAAELIKFCIASNLKPRDIINQLYNKYALETAKLAIAKVTTVADYSKTALGKLLDIRAISDFDLT